MTEENSLVDARRLRRFRVTRGWANPPGTSAEMEPVHGLEMYEDPGGQPQVWLVTADEIKQLLVALADSAGVWDA